jgi:Dual specificity phosphatase, catalytic domain
MGQILPGFWIGRMAAVRTIFELQHGLAEDQQGEEEWTVISVLSSDSIIATVSDTLKTEQRKFGRPLVKRHVIWDLPDKSQANFVSVKLAEILQVISEVLLMRSVNDNNDDDDDIRDRTRTKRPRRNCLVHCARGISRSAAVCSAWLVSAKGYSVAESLRLIRTVRQDVNPNLGFLAGLKAIEKCNGDIYRAHERLNKSRIIKKEKEPGEHDVIDDDCCNKYTETAKTTAEQSRAELVSNEETKTKDDQSKENTNKVEPQQGKHATSRPRTVPKSPKKAQKGTLERSDEISV